MTHALNQYLYDAYGGFSDRRYKKLVFDRPIAVDQHDRDGGGINQSVHVLIWVNVHDNDEISITFSGNVPRSNQVNALIGRLRRIKVDATAVDIVRQLAAEARQVPVPRDNKSLYYARHEVGEDLERLAAHLARYLGVP
ncbi:hypothetical protein [Paraliomyxa miuraensis]|uniref:hypothetical protein n=1 Tax=Paraliomyxa miuraensis TaxID=376150 RepID=UPI00225923EF|nr:hypothetical protein [Paraliomyxa miuraensis]MCX4239184.1 hypothetical protein [Paraliomyxa miuraensis]